ncbi:STAS domain-containing protein [Streptomyces hydrogenans]|uniref:STAS domain-containing protein n=1 Tax=Streptomyces hydrogenans TaxID=1873719 RepID=UPI00278C072F|nr:STAS domain-containing protein [Streptomyces hydrogenans]
MTPDRPQRDVPRARLHLIDGAPAWHSDEGDALVRYAPAGCPTTAALVLAGEFDADTTPCLHEALDAVRTPQIELVLLDVAAVRFGDSALLHELTDTRSRPERHILIGPLPGPIARLLDITGTRHAFEISLDDAA